MIRIFLLLAPVIFLNSCADTGAKVALESNPTPKSQVKSSVKSQVKVGSRSRSPWRVKTEQKGEASWYSVRSNGGTQTASGEKLKEEASTAAHRTLRMGTRVRVTNLRNGKSEIVKITDRGPFTKGRIIDVTTGVARRIGFYSRGVAPVKVEVLEKKKTPGSAS
ncbi:septal ring lytic transglycosylase RlpA family protein [Verrucomicrobiaceae bacterium 227]